KPAAPAKRPRPHFFHLTDGSGRDAELRRTDEPVAWRDCHAEPVYADSMTAALAVGQHGVYVPDVHAIPAADKFVEAWVEWRPYREGDRVAVTLRAVPPFKEVHFDEVPQLHLQVNCVVGEAGRWRTEFDGEAKLQERAGESLTTPL